jgi:CRISPR/Cas system-associated exonuclease Cas4 (RecB family)
MALRYVGVSNLAHYWWCDLQAVLAARAKETIYLQASTKDRKQYSRELAVPESAVFSAENRELLLSSRKYIEVVEDDDLSPAMTYGIRAQNAKGEKYPTIRWTFEYPPYTIVGLPDGITQDFVYEFKTSGTDHFNYWSIPVAETQAHIYGWLFQRPNVRLQIDTKGIEQLQTIVKPTDIEEAIKTLELFQAVEQGKTPPRKTRAVWKCSNCVVAKRCHGRTYLL